MKKALAKTDAKVGELILAEYRMRKVDLLIPYPNNARTHSQDQISKIAGSIKKFGFTNPILVDKNNGIIAGHGRIAAAKLIGMTEVPTICLDHLTEVEVQAYILADNRLALDAGWDAEMVKIEMEQLQLKGFDLQLTGFSLDEIEAYMNPVKLNEGLEDPDAPQGLGGEPISKPGDIWILGNHRLMCGDSTNPDNVMALCLEHNPVIMVTDPPYGVEYDPSWRDGADLGVGERSRGKVKNDDKVDWTDTYSLFTGDIAYVWHAGVYSPAVASHLENCGFEIVSQIIWAKQHFALSRGDYHWQHEPCWYVVRKGKNHNWQGARDQSTTWEIKNNNSFGNSEPEETWGHGTQKPIECMLRPITNNTKPMQYVYDPFGGSGTTLIACEKIGRNCLMMELDPQYVDMIVKRWQKFTGHQATLESNGKPFNDELSI